MNTVQGTIIVNHITYFFVIYMVHFHPQAYSKLQAPSEEREALLS